MFEALGADPKAILSRPLTHVTFFNADLSKSVEPKWKKPPGYLIDRFDFDNVLLDRAAGAGASILSEREMTGTDLFEDRVVVQCRDAEPVEGRFLMLATGRGTPWLERLKLARPTGRGAWSGVAMVDAAEESPVGEPGVDVVLGLDREGSFAVVVRTATGTSVTLTWYSDKTQARPALVQLCHQLVEAGRAPALLSQRTASAPLNYCQTSFALEMDSHVGKNTLVIGDAGGFLATISQEGIYPAMWSARIAADVLIEAMGAKHPQDTLKTFETRWRQEMAPYLSPPNTDVHYLLPMVFSNAAMAERMAGAFFAGEDL